MKHILSILGGGLEILLFYLLWLIIKKIFTYIVKIKWIVITGLFLNMIVLCILANNGYDGWDSSNQIFRYYTYISFFAMVLAGFSLLFMLPSSGNLADSGYDYMSDPNRETVGQYFNRLDSERNESYSNTSNSYSSSNNNSNDWWS